MVPAQRTYGLLLVGLAIFTAQAIVLPSPNQILITIGGLLLFDGVVLCLMFWDGWHSRRDRVEVRRHPLQRLSIGRENPVVLSVTTHHRKTTLLHIRDTCPCQDFHIAPERLTCELSQQGTQDLTYQAKPFRRGEYQWGHIHLRQLSAWKLAWMDWQVPQPQTVAVYPDLVGLRSLSIKLTLQSAGAMRRARRIGMGTEFAELKEYGTGDDPRLIDWKATARRSRPLVRLLEPEQEQTLIILLDRGRLMTAKINGLQRFDWGLNATLALALAGLQRGDRVGVGVFDRTLHTWIPPERGQTHLSTLVERLTPIQPELLEPDYLGAATALVSQQTRRALVVVITDIVDTTASAELLLALGRMTPRYLPFCVTLRDPQVDHQAHQFTTDVTESYGRAVALDLLAQRQVAFAILKQKGVLVLDAPANQITDELVDRYLKLKLRNQL